MKNKIEKILIANRGEIAVRIIKTINKMGLTACVIYSEEDRDSFYVELGDEKYFIGNGSLTDTYLNIEKIISICKKNKIEAVHPGYGFLSENAGFAKACEKEGIIFIGPNSDTIEKMGNKLEARKIAKKSGVPITNSYSGSIEEIISSSNNLKFPVMVKAAAGGGGKGMKVIFEKSELEEALKQTEREAKNYFGDGTVYLEEYISKPKHIEVQILGDNYGKIIHLFERECSVQRRHQKIIEEAPSPSISKKLREEICNAAVKISKEINYQSSGTVEFLLGEDGEFYFLEMNTRIQVEHPVTELITGIDIVEEQIKVAEGQKILYDQENISMNGSAIECRLYAESPENNFSPSPGEIKYCKLPEKPDIRIDSGSEKPSKVSEQFDPLIAKIIAFGATREIAVKKMTKYLNGSTILGIETNLEFLAGVIKSEVFKSAKITTDLIDKNGAKIFFEDKSKLEIPAIVAAFLLQFTNPQNDIWSNIGNWRNYLHQVFEIKDNQFELELIENYENIFTLNINEKEFEVLIVSFSSNNVELKINGENIIAKLIEIKENEFQVKLEGKYFKICRMVPTIEKESILSFNGKEIIRAPMHGKVIKINKGIGDKVSKGDKVIIIESMKMENALQSEIEGNVVKINISEEDRVQNNQELMVIENEKK